MSESPGRPTGNSFAAVLWFPFFFTAAFAVIVLGAFASPAPDGMQLGVTGTDAQVTAIEMVVRQVAGDGIAVRRLPDRQEAERLVRRNELAGAYIAHDPENPELLVASASR